MNAAPPTLHFDDTCTPGRRLIISAVGDLLFHDALQEQAYRPGASFRQFWAPVARVLASADITYGNLESPIAAGVRPGGMAAKDPGRVLDRVVYGRKDGVLVFNTHPSVAADLKASGFTVVSTANNHAADRGSLGIDRTIDALDAAGLAHTGARKRGTGTPWHTRTSANGITVAWLACTFDLNGMPDPHNQVLQCYRDRDVVLHEIRTLARDPAVDAVLVTPHWGVENQHRPLPRERALARDMIEAGATAVLGAHPHVLQPWEKIVATDGREALVIYSLGNFVSNQQSQAQRTGIIALIEVTKPEGAAARLSAAGYMPTYVEMAHGHRVTELRPELSAHAAARDTYRDAMKIVPPGNQVTMQHPRALPRLCRPVPPSTETAGVVSKSPVLMAAMTSAEHAVDESHGQLGLVSHVAEAPIEHPARRDTSAPPEAPPPMHSRRPPQLAQGASLLWAPAPPRPDPERRGDRAWLSLNRRPTFPLGHRS